MNENKLYSILLLVFFMITTISSTPNMTQNVNQEVTITQYNNTIDIPESIKIKEINPGLASKIIKYIKDNKIKSIRELKKINGVGDKELEIIQRHVKVGVK